MEAERYACQGEGESKNEKMKWGPRHVTCTDLQIPRDPASSRCRDIAIKMRLWAWLKMESFDDKASILV